MAQWLIYQALPRSTWHYPLLVQQELTVSILYKSLDARESRRTSSKAATRGQLRMIVSGGSGGCGRSIECNKEDYLESIARDAIGMVSMDLDERCISIAEVRVFFRCGNLLDMPDMRAKHIGMELNGSSFGSFGTLTVKVYNAYGEELKDEAWPSIADNRESRKRRRMEGPSDDYW